MPTEHLQLALLGVNSLLFGIAFVLGLLHLRNIAANMTQAPAGLPHDASMGVPARIAVACATILGLALFAWRALAAQSITLPVTDPFDAFLVLGLLVAFVVVYLRWTRHLRSLSFFLLPMIVILLLLGLLLALVHPDIDRQRMVDAWTLLHIITIFLGTICFVLGCAGGIVYLLADRQLRRKGQSSSHRWFGYPPLASIEKFNRWMIYVGFPLLTISTVAGILRIAQVHAAQPAAAHTLSQAFKIGCGILAWAVYAVLVHVPLNPRFRGPRAAWLSIFGFALFIGAFVAARWN
jgi:ABC-type uncharacterized transport system permease subunit